MSSNEFYSEGYSSDQCKRNCLLAGPFLAAPPLAYTVTLHELENGASSGWRLPKWQLVVGEAKAGFQPLTTLASVQVEQLYAAALVTLK